MKQFYLFLITLFTTLLSSCTWIPQNCASKPDMLREMWPCQINHDPGKWLSGVNSWFLTGRSPCPAKPCGIEQRPREVLTKIAINTPDFIHIDYNGPYMVQIIGGQNCNSVSIVGPYAEAQKISINVYNRTLYISQKQLQEPKKSNTNPFYAAPPSFNPLINKVIIRIGVANIASITNKGCGNIYGRDIMSGCLSLSAWDRGNIMLVGNMNLQQVNQMGSGTIMAIGAQTPALRIKTIGHGNVNISGRVGVQSILHYGNGEVNIIGADTGHLVIDTAGCGKTTVSGIANLKRVTARDSSQVYVCWINSRETTVCARDNARVGLAGNAAVLNIDLTGSAHFEGQYLHGGSVYARTNNQSHANLTTEQKLFAEANDRSSIYYLGPGTISRFTGRDAMIVPVLSHSGCPTSCMPPPINPLTWKSSSTE